MALFKIFKGDTTKFGRPDSFTRNTKEGYAYFTQDDGRFYIDILDSNDVIIGTSSANGANRICINNGSVDFENLVILDCGTATATIITPSDPVEILYFGCGDSSSIITNETVFLNCGSSISQEITADTIFYDCGSSI